MGAPVRGVRRFAERLGFRVQYLLTDLAYAIGIATPKRSHAGAYWSYEITNPHAADPGLRALDTLPGDAVIVDVGAHVGEYAVPLARSTQRRVYAIEPNRKTFARLNRTITRNDLVDRVHPLRVGLADEDGRRSFHRSSYSKISSFDASHARRWGATVSTTEVVPVRRLDGLVPESIPPPDGIKIDVEGLEGAVLDGGAQTIDVHRPLVVLEIHDERDTPRMREWFTDREYAVDRAGETLIARPTVQDSR